MYILFSLLFKSLLVFLKCSIVSGLQVPFIAFYRKEYVEPELNINDLWRVYHWDEKVGLLVLPGKI